MKVKLFWQPSADRKQIATAAPSDLFNFLRQAFGELPLTLANDPATIGALRGAELTHPSDANAYRLLAEALAVSGTIRVEAETESEPVVAKTLRKPPVRTLSPRRG